MIQGWMPAKSTAAEHPRTVAEPGTVTLVCLVAWLMPGGGHLWLGRRQKGIVFLLAIPLMFIVGLQLQGTIFPFQFADLLVGLAAVADLGIGLPYLVAKLAGAGAGNVIAITYEYGNTYAIVAGLLNMLAVLDAFDIAVGRK